MGKMGKISRDEKEGMPETPETVQKDTVKKERQRVIFLSRFLEHKIILSPSTRKRSGISVEFHNGIFASSDPEIISAMRKVAISNPDIKERIPETREEALDRMLRESKSLELEIKKLERERPSEDILKEIASKKAKLASITKCMKVF